MEVAETAAHTKQKAVYSAWLRRCPGTEPGHFERARDEQRRADERQLGHHRALTTVPAVGLSRSARRREGDL